MTKSHNNKSQKENKMEFPKEDKIVIVDETKEQIFGNKQFQITYPCDSKDVVKPECSKRWMESLSDCA